MKQELFTIRANTALTDYVWEMVLEGDTAEIQRPGQFVQLALPELFLRRPISVCDCEPGRLTLVYKLVGAGTREMASMRPGTRLDLLTGLGNGFALEKSGAAPMLVGGGVGIPPLYLLAKKLLAQGKQVTAAFGFNTAAEVFYLKKFQALGVQVQVATLDGSLGQTGLVTELVAQAQAYSYVYACGPEPMLKAVCGASQTSGQFSFEARMGCGFGACMGCSCRTKYGNKRICKDGPVLEKEEILW